MDYPHRLGGDAPFGWVLALQAALAARPRRPRQPLRLPAAQARHAP